MTDGGEATWFALHHRAGIELTPWAVAFTGSL
jgi:hypothetical protein